VVAGGIMGMVAAAVTVMMVPELQGDAARKLIKSGRRLMKQNCIRDMVEGE